MSEDRSNPPPARARAVADAPVQALAARAEELAHRWALALLGVRPLVEMVSVPLEDIARYAPALCASIARALSSESELASFAAGWDARDPSRRAADPVAALSALGAGWDAAAAVEHVEVLRGILWQAALEELHDPTARHVADLSDRLACVCATVLAYALSRDAAAEQASPRLRFVAPREQVLYSTPRSASGASGAALIDERDEPHRSASTQAQRRAQDEPPLTGEPPRPSRPDSADPLERGASRTSARPLPWDTPLRSSAPPLGPAVRGGGGGDPGMRVSRGPVAPADRRSWRS